MVTLNCRYIQGAQLFSNSSVKVESAVPIDSAQSISEGAIMNDLRTSTSNATTLRARFVGQGYKQVKSIVLAIHFI